MLFLTYENKPREALFQVSSTLKFYDFAGDFHVKANKPSYRRRCQTD